MSAMNSQSHVCVRDIIQSDGERDGKISENRFFRPKSPFRKNLWRIYVVTSSKGKDEDGKIFFLGASGKFNRKIFTQMEIF